MLTCKNCLYSTSFGKELFNHVLLHHNVKRIPSVNCGFLDCPLTFSTLNRLETHILKVHNTESMNSSTEEDEDNYHSKMLQCNHYGCKYFTETNPHSAPMFFEITKKTI